MLRRPNWFHYCDDFHFWIYSTSQGRLKARAIYFVIIAASILPFIPNVIFKLIDKSDISIYSGKVLTGNRSFFQRRIERGRNNKMAFDWMIKTYAEKDSNPLNEFSLY